VRQLLNICQPGALKDGDELCRSDTRSDEMYILLTGQLSVVTAEGLRVATILPVTTVGEMGIITGQPRSATVEAIKDSRILTLKKQRFEALLLSDLDISSRIYRNVIHILAGKLVNDNIHLRDQQIEKNLSAARVRSVEQQVHVQKRRFEVLLEYFEQQKILAADGAKSIVEEKMLEDASSILIVDDEVEFRRLVASALPYFNVLEAGNGREALEVVTKDLPDLVITDIKMPEMDGLELLQALREDYPDLPVLAVSGYLGPSELDDHGFNGYIQKPLKLKSFREIVEQALERDG
jgi:CheY-like chemotaxis protein